MFAPSRRRSLIEGLAAALLIAGLGAPAAPAQPAGPVGRWRVAERSLGWPSRLTRLEIRAARNRSGDRLVVAFEADAAGAERLWGSARLEPPRAGAPARAEWADGPDLVTLLLRPEPGGRLVAITRQRNRERTATGPERVRQVTLEPDDERPVINAPPIDLGPADRPRPSEVSSLYVVGADGAGLRPVAVPDGSYIRAAHPSWSPDGTRIAFTAFDPTGREPLIRIVPAAGGPTVAIAAGVAPRWSRDGSRIAYIASGRPDFATDWNAPGRNDERIECVRLAGPEAGAVEVLARGIWPRWAPDDDRLAFAARVGTTWDIYVRSADGAIALRLTDDPATDTYPTWTPDGRSVVFLSDRGNRWDLWKVPADGRGDPQRLTDVLRREDEPDLSPDGRRVAFTDGLARRDSQVMILDLAAGTVRPLLEGAQGDRHPAWSPDGASIAFTSRRPAPLLPVPSGR